MLEIIVLTPSGVLIASGCGLFLYSRFKYGRPTPMFDNYATLKDYLRTNFSIRSTSLVVVEGTLSQAELSPEKLTTNNSEFEDEAITHSQKAKACTTLSGSSLLTDSNGVYIRVITTDKFTHLLSRRTVSQSHKCHLGILGYASVDGQSQEVHLMPLECDKSMTAIVASRNKRKRLLYVGSGLLILSGCFLLKAVITLILPVIRAYKVFSLVSLWMKK